MAIIKNRAQNLNLIISALLFIKWFFIRFCRFFLIIFSIFLIVIFTRSASYNKTYSTIFDFTQKFIIVPTTDIFHNIFNNISSIGQKIYDSKDYKSENVELRLENAKLKKLLEDAAYFVAESKRLQKHYKLSAEHRNYETISGRILNILYSQNSITATIDLGKNSGIEENDVVISEGALVGVILNVSDHYSIVRLITDNAYKASVMTALSGQRLLLVGDSDNLGCKLIHVSDEKKIQIGELVLSSGDGILDAKGLPIARVSRKVGDAIYATPIVDLRNLHFVSIIKNHR